MDVPAIFPHIIEPKNLEICMFLLKNQIQPPLNYPIKTFLLCA